MSPLQAIKSGFRNGLTLKGRASRPEFWWFLAFALVFFLVLEAVFFGSSNALYEKGREGLAVALEWGGVIVGLMVSFPLFTLTVRRFHDRGLSGWWVLVLELGLFFLPSIVGYLFILTSEDSLAIALSNAVDGEPVAKFLFGAFLAQIAGVALIVVQLIIAALPSQKGKNRFGPQP